MAKQESCVIDLVSFLERTEGGDVDIEALETLITKCQDAKMIDMASCSSKRGIDSSSASQSLLSSNVASHSSPKSNGLNDSSEGSSDNPSDLDGSVDDNSDSDNPFDSENISNEIMLVNSQQDKHKFMTPLCVACDIGWMDPDVNSNGRRIIFIREKIELKSDIYNKQTKTDTV